MLKSVIDNTLTIECAQCGNEFTDNCSGKVLRFNEEYGGYENYRVICPHCGGIEFYNVNIPIDDTDEPFITGDLPLEEEIQRYYVRLLIRMVREDFVSAQ